MITREAIKQRSLAWLGDGFRPHPVAQFEWLWMRILFAPIVLWAIWDYHPYVFTEQSHPEGIARIFPLTWISQEWVRPLFFAVAVPAIVLYLLGIGLPIALGVLCLVNILPRTLANSQGHVNHSHQIVSVVLLTQFVVAVWWWWRQHRSTKSSSSNVSFESWQLYYTQGIITGTYVVAGLSKLLNSKGMWFWNAPYISFDLVKSQRQEYYKLLEDASKLTTAPAAEWVMENPMFARVGFAGAFFLELFAIVAMKNRRWAFWTGLALIALHRGILAVMNLHFYNNELLLLIFFLNIPFWFWWIGKKCSGQPAQLS
jgi:hypothetical protein